MIHPALLSSQKIRKYLYNPHIPKTTMLLIEIQRDTSLKKIQKYSEICTIECELIGRTLLFAISIPRRDRAMSKFALC